MKKYIDFMVIPQGQQPAMNFRLATWQTKAIVVVLAVWIIALIAASIFYGKLINSAVTASLLKQENEKLRDYNARVVEIEKSFRKNQALVSRIAEMAGIEIKEVEESLGAVYDSMQADSSERVIIGGMQADKIPLSADELEKFVIPKGRPLYGWITRRFNIDGDNDRHEGIDIAVKEGTPIAATATGITEFAGWDKDFGNLIIIDHGNGYKTIYGHNEKNLVSMGQKVYKGDVIALSGNTGKSSAPHLHYEIEKDGVPIDPSPYLD
jgi:murein DD-endopeptidase MepM/ murein hydrolase activator NlpD